MGMSLDDLLQEIEGALMDDEDASAAKASVAVAPIPR